MIVNFYFLLSIIMI